MEINEQTLCNYRSEMSLVVTHQLSLAALSTR